MESFTPADVAESARYSPPRIVGIDALRALAMTAVFAEHAKLFSAGWAGVWLFYVISGFVVTSSIQDRRIDGQRGRALFQFYTRRAARIWPIYFLMIALAIIVSIAVAHSVPWPAVISLAGFYNNFALALGFGETPAFNTGQLWTISVEMQFYLLYGLLFMLASRRMIIFVLIATIALCPLGRWLLGEHLISMGLPRLNAAFYIYSFSALHFDAFSAGALLALFRLQLTRRFAWSLAIVGVLSLMLYCGWYISLAWHQGVHGAAAFKNVLSGILFGEGREVFVYEVIVILAAAVIALICGGVRFGWLTSSALIRRVGEISYGAYVYHVQTLGITQTMMDKAFHLHGVWVYIERVSTFAIALTITLIIAETSFRLIEQPVIRAVGARLRARTALA